LKKLEDGYMETLKLKIKKLKRKISFNDIYSQA